MISFFIKHKKVRGVITVFLTMIYLSVYLLVGIFVDGGRIRMAQTVVEDIQQIATENVMSQYNRGLYEYYGLMGISNFTNEDIVKEVQNQIKESIGLEIPEDTVKIFMEDIFVGGKSTIEKIDKYFDKNNVIDSSKKVATEVKNDILDYKKRFDPYGIKINNAEVSNIDLTNQEVLRAQMRDEMRYTAPLVLGANFFDAVNELMMLSDSANAIKNVANILTDKENNVEEKQNNYYVALNNFSLDFHDFVEQCYCPTSQDKIKKIEILWGRMDLGEAITKGINHVYNNLKEVVGGAVSILTMVNDSLWKFILPTEPLSIKRILNDIKSTSDEVKRRIKNIGENELAVATDMKLFESGGFREIITVCKDNLSIYYKKFDNTKWCDGNEHEIFIETGVDEEGNVEGYMDYVEPESSDAHRICVVGEVTQAKNEYDASINKLYDLNNKALLSISDSISKINIAMDGINIAEGKFIEVYNTGTEASKTMYAQYMKANIKQWNVLATQRQVLLRLQDKLNKLKDILMSAKDDSTSVVNSFNNEDYYNNWNGPSLFSSKLSNLREPKMEEFHNIMLNMLIEEAETYSLVELQNVADGDGLCQKIFVLLSALYQNKENERANIDEGNSGALFGKVKLHQKSDEDYFKPEDDLKEVSLDRTKIIEEVGTIMDKATEIALAFSKKMADNIYDETYIVSHCRDYVHTYRIPKVYKSVEQAKEKEPDIDTILNTKFVVNQSFTNYLSNEQLQSLQVTPAEIEYILFGNQDSIINVAQMYANIFILRLALNYIAIYTSKNSRDQVIKLSDGVGPFAPLVLFGAPLLYAIPKSVKDTSEILYDCKKVNLYNGDKNLNLWTFFEEDLRESAEDIIKKCKENLIKMKNKSGIIIDFASLTLNGAPQHYIIDAHEILASRNDIDDANDGNIDNVDNKGEDCKKKKIKAGYSDYLLIFLFAQGVSNKGKQKQISRLQDVIETNMDRAQDGFELRKTFSQIGVETFCDIKYIFMTQSFMKKTFKSTDKYNSFSFNIKTAFAY